MLELIDHGVGNVLCLQPFGCLPNHITGKGVLKELKRIRPHANLMAVDYDPGSSEANQLNRIKLFMTVAHSRIPQEAQGDHAPASLNESVAQLAAASPRQPQGQARKRRRWKWQQRRRSDEPGVSGNEGSIVEGRSFLPERSSLPQCCPPCPVAPKPHCKGTHPVAAVQYRDRMCPFCCPEMAGGGPPSRPAPPGKQACPAGSDAPSDMGEAGRGK